MPHRGSTAHMVHWCSRHGTSCSHHATATATPPPRASTRSRACSSAHIYIGIILAGWLWSRHIQISNVAKQYRIGLIGRFGCMKVGGSSNECIMTHDIATGNQIYLQHAATPAMLYELLLLPSGPLEGASITSMHVQVLADAGAHRCGLHASVLAAAVGRLPGGGWQWSACCCLGGWGAGRSSGGGCHRGQYRRGARCRRPSETGVRWQVWTIGFHCSWKLCGGSGALLRPTCAPCEPARPADLPLDRVARSQGAK